MALRVVFMGTPSFAVPSLRRIAASPSLFDVVLVATGCDKPRRNSRSEPEATPVKQAALELGLPVLEADDVKDPAFAAKVAEARPDVIVVAAFRVLPPEVYGLAPQGTFNLHGSLLPAYRGAAPVNWALINGERRTGVTTFFLQRSVDTGNIITFDETPIGPEENASELLDRLAEIGAGTVRRTLSMIASGTVEPQRQDDCLATKAPKLTRENTRIEWNRPVGSVHDFIRGLALKPTAWTTLGGRLVKVYKARPYPGDPDPEALAGAIRVDGGRLLVRCSDGWLELLSLHPEGRKPMGGEAFACGLRQDGEAPCFS